ncbi:MAG: hypothetical protein P9L99_12160 [Candidatus Lernaella stagnicola]|nr:hypothetical protein [Candidatus Lernaella stagnicola]
MKSRWLFIVGLILLLSVSVIACGGGDDDDDVTSGDDDDTPPIGDDDDDDDDNDTAGDDDDDTTDDDTTDDDTADDDVVFTPVYDELRCTLPDPESLGGDTVGGGAATGNITVYVYDDATCDPVVGADVNGVATDVDGLASVPAATKGETLVVATAADHWSWAYQADAAVMYFRLRGDNTFSYGDSAVGEFIDGTALALDNPQQTFTILSLGQLLAAEIFIGGAVPGLARSTILSLDDAGLVAEGLFDINYDFDGDAGTIALPTNIYFPEMDLGLNLIGLLEASADGVNEAFNVPVEDSATEMALEGFVASLTIGEAISTDALLALIPVLIGGGDIIEVVLGLIEPIINDALAFEYQGVLPDWDTTGAPDIDVVSIDETTLDVTTPGFAGYDYLNVLLGEVGNRALWPMGLKIGDDTTFDAAAVDDGDYMLLSGQTNLLAIIDGSTIDALELTFAASYADELGDWGGVVDFLAEDYLPVFDGGTTEYTAGGVVNWALASKADVDAYVVAAIPADGEAGIAVLPGTVSSFDAAGYFDYTVNEEDDVIVVIALDLPASTDLNAWDPTAVAYQNAKSLSLWTNYPIDELLDELLNPPAL